MGGGYCRLQMPLKLALGVRGTVAGHRLGALAGGVQDPGTRGYRWWKAADFSHSARCAPKDLSPPPTPKWHCAVQLFLRSSAKTECAKSCHKIKMGQAALP